MSISDWEKTGSCQWKFLRGPGEVRPSTIVPGGATAVYKGEPCGVFWDKLQPALGEQMALGCVERRYHAEKATEDGLDQQYEVPR
jgi:hypothetical protein